MQFKQPIGNNLVTYLYHRKNVERIPHSGTQR